MIDEEILNSPRFGHDHHPINTLHGLYDLIKHNVKSDSIIVEIGCWRGVSSELFALHCKELYCVDPWAVYNERYLQKETEIAESEFDSRMKKFKHVLKLRMKSVDGANVLKDKILDLVYIDGDHSYDAVKTDIISWKSKLKETGCMCGHDYTLEGVNRAVSEQFGTVPITVYKDTSWCVKMKDYYGQQ